MTSHNQTKKALVLFTASLVAVSATLVQASPRSDDAKAAGYIESEIQALRNEVASLRRQLHLLRQQRDIVQSGSKQAKKRGLGGEGNAQVEQGSDPDEAARLSKRFGAINKQFKSEDVDAKWAYVAEYRVREALKGAEVNQIPDASIACRASLCRLEIKSDNDVQLSELGRDLAMKLSREFPRGFVHRENTDSGMSSFVVYLAREGQRLHNPDKKK